jgi:ketosteroid isomerase-like protein
MKTSLSTPAGSTARTVLDRHLAAFAAGDLDALLSDYSEASILFTAGGPLVGIGAIRGFMSPLFTEFAKPGAKFDLARMDVAGDVGFIVWSAKTADNVYELATDTFVVRDGKIAFQTFAGKVVPRRSSDD